MVARAVAPVVAARPAPVVGRGVAPTVSITIPSVFSPTASVFPTASVPRLRAGTPALSRLAVGMPGQPSAAIPSLWRRVRPDQQDKSMLGLRRAPAPAVTSTRLLAATGPGRLNVSRTFPETALAPVESVQTSVPALPGSASYRNWPQRSPAGHQTSVSVGIAHRQTAHDSAASGVLPGPRAAELSRAALIPGLMVGQTLASRTSVSRVVLTQAAPPSWGGRPAGRTVAPLVASDAHARSYPGPSRSVNTFPIGGALVGSVLAPSPLLSRVTSSPPLSRVTTSHASANSAHSRALPPAPAFTRRLRTVASQGVSRPPGPGLARTVGYAPVRTPIEMGVPVGSGSHEVFRSYLPTTVAHSVGLVGGRPRVPNATLRPELGQAPVRPALLARSSRVSGTEAGPLSRETARTGPAPARSRSEEPRRGGTLAEQRPILGSRPSSTAAAGRVAPERTTSWPTRANSSLARETQIHRSTPSIVPGLTTPLSDTRLATLSRPPSRQPRTGLRGPSNLVTSAPTSVARTPIPIMKTGQSAGGGAIPVAAASGRRPFSQLRATEPMSLPPKDHVAIVGAGVAVRRIFSAASIGLPFGLLVQRALGPQVGSASVPALSPPMMLRAGYTTCLPATAGLARRTLDGAYGKSGSNRPQTENAGPWHPITTQRPAPPQAPRGPQPSPESAFRSVTGPSVTGPSVTGPSVTGPRPAAPGLMSRSLIGPGLVRPSSVGPGFPGPSSAWSGTTVRPPSVNLERSFSSASSDARDAQGQRPVRALAHLYTYSATNGTKHSSPSRPQPHDAPGPHTRPRHGTRLQRGVTPPTRPPSAIPSYPAPSLPATARAATARSATARAAPARSVTARSAAGRSTTARSATAQLATARSATAQLATTTSDGQPYGTAGLPVLPIAGAAFALGRRQASAQPTTSPVQGAAGAIGQDGPGSSASVARTIGARPSAIGRSTPASSTSSTSTSSAPAAALAGFVMTTKGATSPMRATPSRTQVSRFRTSALPSGFAPPTAGGDGPGNDALPHPPTFDTGWGGADSGEPTTEHSRGPSCQSSSTC